jgi:hypothetical protein
LFVAPGTDPVILEREIEACRRIEFNDVAWAERAPFEGIDTGRCLRFPRQARFHPLKYLDGLARCINRDRGRLFANTRVVSVDEGNDEVVVKTEDGLAVRATAGVIATNTPINDRIAIHTKQAPYRTYVVTARVPRGSVVDALYWDTLDPYHYVRLQPAAGGAHDWLIVGGEDHKTGEANDFDERFARLEGWTRAHFPQAGGTQHRWSGQVIEPVDHAPYVGRNQGAIIRRGMQKVAAYRDENGRLYLRSAACTHANCIVQWNALEKCWDCPCTAPIIRSTVSRSTAPRSIRSQRPARRTVAFERSLYRDGAAVEAWR